MAHEVKIGQLLGEDAKRDAVHIALFPAIAGEELDAGDEVGLLFGTTNVIISYPADYGCKPMGIVDPFLGMDSPDGEGRWQRRRVLKGGRCYVFLHPGQVTGVRHEWECAAIDSPPVNFSESAVWLHQFAQKW